MDLFRNTPSAQSCHSLNVSCIASNVVEAVTCNAIKLIESDYAEKFLYPLPKVKVTLKHSTITTMDEEDIKEEMEWVNIGDFTLSQCINQIRDYIANWRLTPPTKYVLIAQEINVVIPSKGTIYFANALFSKPTPQCPNPLAVATVRFKIHVSKMLPQYYPIMVCYNFEGYKTTYYAIGRKAVQSFDFQHYFIDSILQKKLSFYSKVFEYQHSNIEDRKLLASEEN